MPRAMIIQKWTAKEFEQAVFEAESLGGKIDWNTFRVVPLSTGDVFYVVLGFFPKEIYLKKR